MFGKYTSEAIKGISKERTHKIESLIKEMGGEVKSVHLLTGNQDLIMVVSLPGFNEAMKASVTLNRLTGILFSTSEAMTVEEFDKTIS